METLSWSGRRGRRHARRASQGNTRNGGWFGGAQSAPELPLDTSGTDRGRLRNSDRGLGAQRVPGSHHLLNHEVNARYASAALNNGTLDIPVLLIGAAYDQVADIRSPSALDPMRESCTDFSEVIVAAGHWLQLEAEEKPRPATPRPRSSPPARPIAATVVRGPSTPVADCPVTSAGLAWPGRGCRTVPWHGTARLRDLRCVAAVARQARMLRSPKLQCESGRTARGSSRPRLRAPASGGHPSQSSTGRDNWAVTEVYGHGVVAMGGVNVVKPSGYSVGKGIWE